MTELEAKAPGLFLAGHYRDGISLGDSIVSGHNAAVRVRAFLSGRKHLLDESQVLLWPIRRQERTFHLRVRPAGLGPINARARVISE